VPTYYKLPFGGVFGIIATIVRLLTCRFRNIGSTVMKNFMTSAEKIIKAPLFLHFLFLLGVVSTFMLTLNILGTAWYFFVVAGMFSLADVMGILMACADVCNNRAANDAIETKLVAGAWLVVLALTGCLFWPHYPSGIIVLLVLLRLSVFVTYTWRGAAVLPQWVISIIVFLSQKAKTVKLPKIPTG
jgi:hypothetical protein